MTEDIVKWPPTSVKTRKSKNKSQKITPEDSTSLKSFGFYITNIVLMLKVNYKWIMTL